LPQYNPIFRVLFSEITPDGASLSDGARIFPLLPARRRRTDIFWQAAKKACKCPEQAYHSRKGEKQVANTITLVYS
jgi:hypothetical protein